jgi:hypothetical protein
MQYSLTQGSATSDSRWLLAISIHNSAFAAGKFGEELTTDTWIVRAAGPILRSRLMVVRAFAWCIRQMEQGRRSLLHILYFSSTWKGGVSRTSPTPPCAVTPSHLFRRMRNPDCGADITNYPSTPTPCTLISRGCRVSLYFGPLLTQLTPSVHSLLTSFYFLLSTSSCSRQSYCHTF